MVEQNVEVDPFIGQTFGEGGHLRVVERAPNSHHNRRYFVKCSNCEKDPELYGDAIFSTDKTSLVRGGAPCGCSKRTSWTEQQWLIRVMRACKENNYSFMGYENKNLAGNNHVVLTCNRDGYQWRVKPSDLLNSGIGCRKCYEASIFKRSSVSEEEGIRRFLATGAFPQGTKFTKLPSSKNYKSYWNYVCPICAEDEFSKIGLCTGVFTNSCVALQNGRRNCRCIPAPILTENQEEYRITKKLTEEESGLKFAGWVTSYVNKKSKFLLKQNDILQEMSVASFDSGTRIVDKNCYDPKKIGYLYVFLAEGICNSFVGYGISNVPLKRLRVHRAALKKVGMTIKNLVIYTGNGNEIYTHEKFIKNNYELFRQGVEGFKTEATYVENMGSLIQYLNSKLKQFNKQQKE